MAKDLERRVGDIKLEFEQYIQIFYKWLDELRTDMKDHSERMRKLEDLETLMVRMLRNHEDRLTGAGI